MDAPYYTPTATQIVVIDAQLVNLRKRLTELLGKRRSSATGRNTKSAILQKGRKSKITRVSWRLALSKYKYTHDLAIDQVHGIWPFHIHWRDGNQWRDSFKTLDSTEADKIFKFRKGERVVTKRGKGRIRQGFDTGEVKACEIDGEDGNLFMAEESEIRSAEKKK